MERCSLLRPSIVSAPGTKEVNAAWTAGVHKSQRYEGWEAIKIVYQEALESNKSAFKLVCDQTTPDLTVRIRHCPRSVKQGYELGSLVKVVAINRGEVPVKDVDLDIVLKKREYLSCSDTCVHVFCSFFERHSS